jgi:hypothetical protein
MRPRPRPSWRMQWDWMVPSVRPVQSRAACTQKVRGLRGRAAGGQIQTRQGVPEGRSHRRYVGRRRQRRAGSTPGADRDRGLDGDRRSPSRQPEPFPVALSSVNNQGVVASCDHSVVRIFRKTSCNQILARFLLVKSPTKRLNVLKFRFVSSPHLGLTGLDQSDWRFVESGSVPPRPLGAVRRQ